MFDAARNTRGARLLASPGGLAATGGPPTGAPGEDLEDSDPATLIARWAGAGADGEGTAATDGRSTDRQSTDGRSTRLLVGTIDEVVVGLAAGTVPSPDVPARVDVCYVEPGAREMGLGSELLSALLQWFTAAGCTDVDALSLPGDRLTKQLLETAGFKTRLLVLHRPIDPHRPIGPHSARG